MRIAAWTFVVCVALAATSLFLPSIHVKAASNTMFAKRSSLSLFAVSSNQDFAKGLLRNYHATMGKRMGGALIAALLPKMKLKGVLSDVKDAKDVLDTVSDDDANTFGRVLAVTIYGFLALCVLALGLMFGDTIAGTNRKKRTLIAGGITVVIAVLAVAMHFGVKLAVEEANYEVERELLGVTTGAYLVPLAGVGALAAIVTLAVLLFRAERKSKT